jgi:hypothetical protein
VTLGGASFKELEIEAQMPALAVDELAEFGARAESLFAIPERLFSAV